MEIRGLPCLGKGPLGKRIKPKLSNECGGERGVHPSSLGQAEGWRRDSGRESDQQVLLLPAHEASIIFKSVKGS